MIAPASIKKKIASSVYFAPPLYIFCTTVIKGYPLIMQSDATHEMVRDQAKGTPINSVTKNKIKSTAIGLIRFLHLPLFQLRRQPVCAAGI